MRRCLITHNECGTDTWRVGWSCPCLQCQAYLAEQRLAHDGGHAKRVWTETLAPGQVRAFELWAWCAVNQEDYERSVCMFRRDGIATPLGHERVICQREAARMRGVMEVAMAAEGITAREQQNARRSIDHYLQRGARGIETLRTFAKGPKS